MRKSFVGTAPAVTVVREDKNGTKASATYTPTVYSGNTNCNTS
ncbi:MAG: hypothetical protein ACLS9T_10310 [Streptococcus salivarius]